VGTVLFPILNDKHYEVFAMYQPASVFRVSWFRCHILVWMAFILLCVSFPPSVSLAQQPAATLSSVQGTVLANDQKEEEGSVPNADDAIETQTETTSNSPETASPPTETLPAEEVGDSMGTGTKIALGVGLATAVGGGIVAMINSGNQSDGTISAIPEGFGVWIFDEQGTTSGCVGTAPGSQGNGTYFSHFFLQVERKGNSLTGSGNCSDGNPIHLQGTISATGVQFRRYGPGCTPGYTVDWEYSGSVEGNQITGTFSGEGDPFDGYAEGCSTVGNFSITIQ
jgi:hypothetical protein